METPFALALSGGGARGMAHIGVLKALQEKKLQPQAVAGTSAGALVAVLTAAGTSVDRMEELSGKLSTWRFMLQGWSGGMKELSHLRDLLHEAVGETDLADLKIPCWIAVTNLQTGRVEYLDRGPAVDLAVASCGVPPFIRPVEVGDRLYIDGGVVRNLPVEPLLADGSPVYGVNVTRRRRSDQVPDGPIALALRTLEIVIASNSEADRGRCDDVLDIEAAYDIGFLDFGAAAEAIQAGYDTARRWLAS